MLESLVVQEHKYEKLAKKTHVYIIICVYIYIYTVTICYILYIYICIYIYHLFESLLHLHHWTKKSWKPRHLLGFQFAAFIATLLDGLQGAAQVLPEIGRADVPPGRHVSPGKRQTMGINLGEYHGIPCKW